MKKKKPVPSDCRLDMLYVTHDGYNKVDIIVMFSEDA